MKDKFCPRLSFAKETGSGYEIVDVPCQQHACEFFQHIIGIDAQTGAKVDEWACVEILSMRLSVANTMKLNQNIAAIDKLATLVDHGNENFLRIATAKVIKLESSNG